MFKFLVLFFLPAIAIAKSTPLYYGPTSQEGVLTFSASVDMYSLGEPTEEAAKKQIGQQYFYMLGNLRWAVEDLSTTVSKGYVLSGLSIAPMGGDLYRVSYTSKTNVLLEKAKTAGDLKFSVPRDPDFAATLDQSCNHDKAEPNWYGFDPHLEGCPMVLDKDYIVVTGHVETKANTVETYPEYDKLISEKDNTLHMSVLMNDEITKPDGLIAKLVGAGFTRHTLTDEEIATELGFTPSKMPKVDDLVRTTGSHGMKVRIFYGSANIDSAHSKAFHYFYKTALENDDVVVYSGHSGLSRNIDLALIEKRENFKITVRPTYQLYFLAGCITYGYYVDDYLATKSSPTDPRGTKNLDVITFGTASPGYDDKPLFAVTDALLAYTADGTRRTYQAVTNLINYSWFGIVGDEDNSPSAK